MSDKSEEEELKKEIERVRARTKRGIAQTNAAKDQIMEDIVDTYSTDQMERLYKTVVAAIEDLPISDEDKVVAKFFLLTGIFAATEVKLGRQQ